jgi:hypothetical protein
MYEVQTRFANDQFENCWTDGNETPVRFRTYREARTELTQYLKDQHQAVEAGDMLDKYSESDFRIVKVED